MGGGEQVRDWVGRTAVHCSAAGGDVDALSSALAAGGDPALPDKAGMTPLHFAAQAQNLSVVELLLGVGVTVDAAEKHGNTALFTAVDNYRGDPSTLRALLAAGADPGRRNAFGVSPRSLADKIAGYDVAVLLADAESTGR